MQARTSTLIDGRSIVNPAVSYQDVLVDLALRPTDDCTCTILPSLHEAITAWDCVQHPDGHPRDIKANARKEREAVGRQLDARSGIDSDSPFQVIDHQVIGLVDLGKL